MLVCTLGDLLLDVVVRLDDTLAVDDDTPARTQVGAGGQAANVAAWAAALGASARVITKRGGDDASELAARAVERHGVEILGPVVEAGGGVVVSVVRPGDGRSMLTDRGPSADLRPDEVDVTWLRGSDIFHLSGYALLFGPIAEAGARAAGAARAQGARISVDLASAEGIRTFGPSRVAARLRQLKPDVVFATERELEALPDAPPAPILVIKRGAGGVMLVEDGHRTPHGAHRAEVVDPTGAGDALAAGFLVGGIELGLDAAARCVSTVGSMP